MSRDCLHLSLSVLLCAILPSCSQYVEKKYRDVTWAAGTKHVVEVSTYPAWFPSTEEQVPGVYTQVESHGEVFFEVHVRNARRGLANRHQGIESCVIKSFSYQLPGKEWVTVITERNPVQGSFWQQRDGPVPFREGEEVRVRVRVKLNGEDRVFEGTMKAIEDSTIPYPAALNSYAV